MRGIKGRQCTEVTAKINEALGEVYETKPTKEMFEQKVEVSEENTVSEGWGGGGGSWGSGSDSWGSGGSSGGSGGGGSSSNEW